MYDALTLHTDYTLPPVLEVVLVADQEGNQHGRVHLTDLDAAEAARVAIGDILCGVGGRIFMVRKRGAGCVRIEVEEVVALGADEVVRR